MIGKHKHTRTDPRDVNRFILWLSIGFFVVVAILCNIDKIKELF